LYYDCDKGLQDDRSRDGGGQPGRQIAPGSQVREQKFLYLDSKTRKEVAKSRGPKIII
jgi:hypothetical protein